MLAALLLATAPVTIASTDDLLEFSYSWSAEANSIPVLRTRFRTDAAKQRKDARRMAAEDRTARLESGSSSADWNPHMFSRAWETLGSTPRLLSLEGSTGVYSGGAHGNSHSQTLLWDKFSGRETAIQALLLPGTSWQAAIHQPYCVLLRRERNRRLGPDTGSYNPGCPPYKDLAVGLEDVNKNGRLDHVRLTADPYVAGSYAEGDYVITLPLTTTMLARLKPEYRASFEARRPIR